MLFYHLVFCIIPPVSSVLLARPQWTPEQQGMQCGSVFNYVVCNWLTSILTTFFPLSMWQSVLASEPCPQRLLHLRSGSHAYILHCATQCLGGIIFHYSVIMWIPWHTWIQRYRLISPVRLFMASEHCGDLLFQYMSCVTHNLTTNSVLSIVLMGHQQSKHDIYSMRASCYMMVSLWTFRYHLK